MKYRKKPIVIDAIQWTGKNVEEVREFALTSSRHFSFNDNRIYIDTLEGSMYAKVGDWIIKGVNNELYPCKPDVFDATYEAVEASSSLGSNQGSSRISSAAYCVEDGCWWECTKCGANSTQPFSEHKVTYRGPACDGVVTKRSSIRRTLPIKDLGTIEFNDGLDD